MKCIFCPNSSHDSKSVEHVIPESLGNLRYILQKGIVCDQCNNYFARKIEGPLLEMPFFRQTRHKRNVVSKKGRIPSDKGFIIYPDLAQVLFNKHPTSGETIEIPDEQVRKRLSKRKKVAVFIPEFGFFDTSSLVVSRFLAKIAIEGLTYDVLKENENVDQVVNQKAFDRVKQYCRFAKTNEFWPYLIRQVKFPDQPENPEVSSKLKKLISEYTFIYVPPGHFFVQFYYSGVEFTMDMVNPVTDQIVSWLTENPGISEVVNKASPIRS